jgi:hypothetical protein
MYLRFITRRIISLKSISHGTIAVLCKTPFNQGGDAVVMLFIILSLQTLCLTS